MCLLSIASCWLNLNSLESGISFQGQLLQSADANSIKFVPRTTPLLLELALESDGSVLVSQEVDTLLNLIFDLRVNFTWHSYEKCVAYFFALRCILERDEPRDARQTLKLKHVFRGAVVAPQFSYLLDNEIPLSCHQVVSRSAHFPLTQAAAEKYQNQVVLPGAGNPGFDIVVPVSKSKFLLLEARHSMQNGRVSIQDIQSKIQLIIQRIESTTC